MAKPESAIRTARAKKGLSQRELAEQIGVGASVISFYESGKRQPSLPVIKSLTEVLDITADEIIDSYFPKKEASQ